MDANRSSSSPAYMLLCVPKSQEPCCQRFLLLLPKSHTQVNQLCLSIYGRYIMNSHWGPLMMPTPLLGLRLLMLHFLLHSGPHCLAGTHGLITFIISHLPPRCQRCWVLQGHGVLALTPIYAVLVLPRVSAHCTPAWHHREHYQYSPSGQSGKHTPRCQAVPATLFGKWELTACNPFSILSSEPSTTSQSSNWSPCQENRGHQYHMLSGGHWLPPSSGASDSPTCWISCQLCQLYR